MIEAQQRSERNRRMALKKRKKAQQKWSERNRRRALKIQNDKLVVVAKSTTLMTTAQQHCKTSVGVMWLYGVQPHDAHFSRLDNQSTTTFFPPFLLLTLQPDQS